MDRLIQTKTEAVVSRARFRSTLLVIAVLTLSLVAGGVANALVLPGQHSAWFNRPSTGLPMTHDPLGGGAGGSGGGGGAVGIPVRMTPASMVRTPPPPARRISIPLKWSAGAVAAAGLSAGLMNAFNESINIGNTRPNDAGQGPQISALDDPFLHDHMYGDPDRIQDGRAFDSGDVQAWTRNTSRCGWYLTVTHGVASADGTSGSVNFQRAVTKENTITTTSPWTCEERFGDDSAYTLPTPSARGESMQCINVSDPTRTTTVGNPNYNPNGWSGGVLSFTCSAGFTPYFVNFAYNANTTDPVQGQSRVAGSTYVFEGWQAHFDAWVRDETRAGVEVICRNGSGQTQTVTGYSDKGPGSDMRPTMPMCPEGYAPVSMTTFIDSGPLGKTVLSDVEVDPAFAAAYPACVGPVAVFCKMEVLLDGLPCDFGRGECRDWYREGLENPQRLQCQWGPYILPWAECLDASHSYATPEGTTQSRTDYPAWYPPQPVDPETGTVPGSYPGSPGNQPDPRYDARDHGCSAFDWGAGVTPHRVSPSGLQPVALYGLRCVLEEFPELQFTSGYRTDYTVPGSGHPRGLSTDVSHPDWAAENGRTYLWEVATYLVNNAGWLQISHVIWDKSIWTRAAGWRPYTYSGGPATGHDADHTNHIDIRFGLAGHTGTNPTPNPYPPANPAPNPAPPTNPAPNPNPTPTPNPGTPVIPETGTNPEDPNGCMSAMWSWNPADWVLVPVQCATAWAFVPTEPALQQARETITQASTGTGVPQWIETLQAVPPVMAAPESPTQGCMGPPMRLPDPFPTIYLFEACDGVRATMAGYTKTFMTVGLIVGTMLTATTLVSRGFGYDAATGGGAKA